MANNSSSFKLPQRIANVYFKVQKATKNIHQAASSIGFIEKCLHNHIVPKFAEVNGQFTCDEDKLLVQRQVMKSHLKQHFDKLNTSVSLLSTAKNVLLLLCGDRFGKLLLKRVETTLRKDIVASLTTKNKKINRMLINKVIHEERLNCPPVAPKDTTSKPTNAQPVPVINLSVAVLSDIELNTLSFGLDHSFVDKNAHVKKHLAASMETVADRVTSFVDNTQKEHLHEFLRANTDIFTKNIYSSKDTTFSNLKALCRDKNIAVVPGDKDSSVVLLNKSDYLEKMQNMLDKGIQDGIYEAAADTILSDLKKFNRFVYNHFKKSKLYNDLTASSNQPGQLYGTAKTHKYQNPSEITLDTLKFRPIISQVGTHTHSAAKAIGEYLKPLVSDNELILNNTQDFASIIREEPPLAPDEEYVSYDVESLFTNVPLHDTIEYILDEIYNNNKLPQLCKRAIFKKLLLKLTSDNIFMFNDKFYRQKDGCTMGGPLSVIMSNIFMTKLEKDVVIPTNPKLYKRYVDDIIARRKKNIPDILLEAMSSYHSKINFTVENNPAMFLDTRMIIDIKGVCATKVYRKPNKVPSHWFSKTPVRYKRNAIIGDLHRSKKISSYFRDEVKIIRQKYLNAGFPSRFVDSVIRTFECPKPDDNEDLPLIPSYFFEAPPFILIDVPYCPENEKHSKHFINKLKSFLSRECTVVIKWTTRKIKTLFSLKSKNPYPSYKIYEGTCSCGSSYIGETKRNTEVRWNEHNDPRGKSEPSKHLYNNPSHKFSWRVILSASKNARVRRNLEASVVALKMPDLNNQVDSKKLTLFRYGVT